MKLKNVFLLLVLILTTGVSALEYKAYDFQELSRQLNYPDRTYFGSTEEEVSDLDTYTSTEDTYYKEINGYLRNFPNEYSWNGISPLSASKIVNSIDNIFKRIPSLPADIVLFRGVSLKYRNDVPFKIGEEILEKGYLSTSASFDIAYEFTKDNGSKNPSRNKKAVFVLYQGEGNGEKAILIDDQNEDEVLFVHGKLLKFMSVKSLNPYFDSYLVQICKVSCDTSMNLDIKKYWDKYKLN